jgi:hypothetical protein
MNPKRFSFGTSSKDLGKLAFCVVLLIAIIGTVAKIGGYLLNGAIWAASPLAGQLVGTVVSAVFIPLYAAQCTPVNKPSVLSAGNTLPGSAHDYVVFLHHKGCTVQEATGKADKANVAYRNQCVPTGFRDPYATPWLETDECVGYDDARRPPELFWNGRMEVIPERWEEAPDAFTEGYYAGTANTADYWFNRMQADPFMWGVYKGAYGLACATLIAGLAALLTHCAKSSFIDDAH